MIALVIRVGNKMKCRTTVRKRNVFTLIAAHIHTENTKYSGGIFCHVSTNVMQEKSKVRESRGVIYWFLGHIQPKQNVCLSCEDNMTLRSNLKTASHRRPMHLLMMGAFDFSLTADVCSISFMKQMNLRRQMFEVKIWIRTRQRHISGSGHV